MDENSQLYLNYEDGWQEIEYESPLIAFKSALEPNQYISNRLQRIIDRMFLVM